MNDMINGFAKHLLKREKPELATTLDDWQITLAIFTLRKQQLLDSQLDWSRGSK
jgi:hypothetical protein